MVSDLSKPGYRSDWLDDRGVGVRVPVGARIFISTCLPDRLWGPLSQWVLGDITPGIKRPGVKLSAHFQLVPWSRKLGSTYPLPNTSSWRSASLVKHLFTFAQQIKKFLESYGTRSFISCSQEPRHWVLSLNQKNRVHGLSSYVFSVFLILSYHLHPTSAVVKKTWIYICTSPYIFMT
jgi:hypothetical protein